MMLLFATLLFMILLPICFSYKETANTTRIIVGIVCGLTWPISVPILIGVFAYKQLFSKQ